MIHVVIVARSAVLRRGLRALLESDGVRVIGEDNNPPDGSHWELLCLYCHDNEHARKQVADASAAPTPGGEHEPPYTYKPFADPDDVLKCHT